MRFFILVLPFFLTACASDRFSGSWTPVSSAPPPTITQPPTIYQQNPNADLEMPNGSRPLPPMIQSTPLPDSPTTVAPITPKPPVVAALPAATAPPLPRPNLGPLGSWTVKDTEGSCRLTLTSQAFFDFQRASSNCKGASLSKVNAWEKKGSEIILYEPGGKVAARLSDQGGSGYAGSTGKGAEIQMSR